MTSVTMEIATFTLSVNVTDKPAQGAHVLFYICNDGTILQWLCINIQSRFLQVFVVIIARQIVASHSKSKPSYKLHYTGWCPDAQISAFHKQLHVLFIVFERNYQTAIYHVLSFVSKLLESCVVSEHDSI